MKPISSTLLKRLSFIDEELAKRNYPDKKKLAEKYEVSTKTIQRDIDFLKIFLNAPVEFDKKIKGYYYTEKDFCLNPLKLNNKDIFALAVADKVLSQYGEIPFTKDIESLYRKLFYLYDGRMTQYTDDLDETISFRLGDSRQIDLKIFDELKNAIKEFKTVDSVYLSGRSGKLLKGFVDPYHIMNNRGEWYLVGYSHTNKLVKVFAVSRFKKVEIINKEFTIIQDFNKKKFFENSFNIFETKNIYKVKLHFHKEYAGYITEKTWHKSQKIKEKPDGSIICEMRINDLTEIKYWILSWGMGCTVIGPKKLRDEIEEEVREMLKNYS